MLMSKIYVVNVKNVIGMSDPNVIFKGPGPMAIPIFSKGQKFLFFSFQGTFVEKLWQ